MINGNFQVWTDFTLKKRFSNAWELVEIHSKKEQTKIFSVLVNSFGQAKNKKRILHVP